MTLNILTFGADSSLSSHSKNGSYRVHFLEGVAFSLFGAERSTMSESPLILWYSLKYVRKFLAYRCFRSATSKCDRESMGMTSLLLITRRFPNHVLEFRTRVNSKMMIYKETKVLDCAMIPPNQRAFFHVVFEIRY